MPIAIPAAGTPPLDVARTRLLSQRIQGAAPAQPEAIVRWLGAVQAQDYLSSLWAIGLRSGSANESVVEAAASNASIVRTWPMRGTIHFVAAEDVRWMLGLLAPRVLALSAGRHRQLGLDAGVLARSERLIVKALEGGRQLTRPAIYRILEDAGIGAGNSRGLHILSYLSQQAVLCFGPRQGKQPTFALLDEWVAPSPRPSSEEALANLARRYYASHGPAGLHDFAWWSGLTAEEARRATVLASGSLEERLVEGRRLWLVPDSQTAAVSGAVHLLPYFDEYTVAYRDRSDVVARRDVRAIASGGMLRPIIVFDGKIIGTWRRAVRGSRVHVTPEPFERMTPRQSRGVEGAALRYASFLGLELALA